LLLELKLDGRKFRVDVRSAAVGQGDYLAQHLRAAGVTGPPQALKDATRPKERIVDDLVTQILAGEQKSYILAGCLSEKGRAWTRSEADANAARFDRITNVSEKAAMQTCLAECVARVVLVWTNGSTAGAQVFPTLQEIGG
jgi:hypothetical protein